MDFVSKYDQIIDNAEAFADAIDDGFLDGGDAATILARCKVFLPFRRGSTLAFAPAKFIGYHGNSVTDYLLTGRQRHGGRARKAVTRVIGFNAVEDASLEKLLSSYCDRLGVVLQKNRHSFWITSTARRAIKSDRSAINDIEDNIGNDDPEYRERMSGTYSRDQSVRQAVLLRADGKCEYCGRDGFIAKSGIKYLEAHHIIRLADQGPDRVHNVIALCADDHRRAHFGTDWKSLNEAFSKIVQDKGGH